MSSVASLDTGAGIGIKVDVEPVRLSHNEIESTRFAVAWLRVAVQSGGSRTCGHELGACRRHGRGVARMVRRAQRLAPLTYAEPIDLLRCKLAFFGASHFDPRSDRWVRISLCQGAIPGEFGG